ncbi:hypothetical protein BLOT_000095 [Blomia tropicalis]|nr:hypothetical protein BLOT_000095 [Blomia tropicalis]
MMQIKCLFLVCVALICVSAEEYNQIMKMLTVNDQQASAQTYSASVADPNESYQSSRSRYSASSSKNDDDDEKKAAEEEEEKKPDRLALLLADSKFNCDSHKNGYYADESVGCQVFHYCVEGVKHSWQCPENTVFHQIHLNCVPNTQDICGESSKFHVVNDYLHKELNERGPNNTILYHQRFYPEGFDYSGGDTVTQIFQAQAQAQLQKAQNRNRDQDSDRDSYNSYDDEQPRARPSRPKSYSPQSQSRLLSKPSYKPSQGRSSIPATYAPISQPVPTKRPITYSTPEAFTPPAYTESSDDFSSNDFSSSSGPSSSSGSSNGVSNFANSNLGGSSGFSAGGSSSHSNFQPSSQSSFSSGGHSSHGSHSNHGGHSQSSQSFRPASRPSSYPTRSLGIPIASFRVAPTQGYSAGAAGSASNIHEVNVPMLNVPTAYHQQARGYYVI